MNEIQKLALANVNVTADRSQIQPGTYAVPPFTVEIRGEVKVSPNETYTPTADIPLIPVVALALKKMGVQREHFMKVLRESVTEVVLADSNLRQQLVSQSGLAEFETEFRQKVLAELPSKTRNGKVRADLTVVQVMPAIVR